MDLIVGDLDLLGVVAIKALLLYLTAVVGFRIGERRTLAEMSPFDFVAAVAVGAVVGRIPNAHDTSYIEGAITLVVILAAHALITRLRYLKPVSGLIDHAPRLLVAEGKILKRELRRSGFTNADLEGMLRQRNLHDISQVQYVIFEQRGKISVIPRGLDCSEGNLLTPVIRKTRKLAADDGDFGRSAS